MSRFKQAAVGRGANLWKAVKLAKNLNLETIPDKLTLNNVPVTPSTTAEYFARYFSEKTCKGPNKHFETLKPTAP